jgi:hypothetical protein
MFFAGDTAPEFANIPDLGGARETRHSAAMAFGPDSRTELTSSLFP